MARKKATHAKTIQALREAARTASPIWTKDGEFATQALLFIAERLATIERVLSADETLKRIEARIVKAEQTVRLLEGRQSEPVGAQH